MKALLTVAYLGTAYHGYQVQKNGVSVQEMLNRAALSVFGFDCDIVGCSRTDSGVHARGFVAAVTQKGSNALPTAIPVSRIPRAMNAHLPADISVLSAKEVPEDFHPRYDVVAKEYEYLFYDGAERDPFWEGRAFPVHPPLNETALAAMRPRPDALSGNGIFRRCGIRAPTQRKKTAYGKFSASGCSERGILFLSGCGRTAFYITWYGSWPGHCSEPLGAVFRRKRSKRLWRQATGPAWE